MEYYRILNFLREPFSNSPEPELFYQSPQHVECLQKLELAVRLRRGLNVVIGDVGTGKTTLCRRLLRRLDGDEEIETHLLLDPYFSRPVEFLQSISEMFGSVPLEEGSERTEWQLREGIKHHLFERGVRDGKLVVLIIDEGQKIPGFCLEILREFLNYETNEAKLLQILIFAQKEFEQVLEDNPGVADRVSFSYYLGPLNFRDTRSMIEFRLQSAAEEGKQSPRLSYWAYRKIYRTTRGYPRRIVSLCHQIMLALIIQNKFKADRFLVGSCVRRSLAEVPERRSYDGAAVLAGLAVILAVLVLFPERVGIVLPDGAHHMTAIPAVSPQSLRPAPPAPVATGEPLPGNVQKVDVTADRGVEETAGDRDVPEMIAEITAAAANVAPVEAIKGEPSGPIESTGTVARHPVVLGLARVAQNGIVWHMIEDVYGVCDRSHLERIAEANPHIKNLDMVFADDIIMFPSIPAEFQPSYSESDMYWVEVDNEKTLERAYRKLKESRIAAGNVVRLCPYWNVSEGLRFSLILRERFVDEDSAREALQALPDSFTAKARILKHWKEGTVFFSLLANDDGSFAQ